jgi:hypothetical protein
VHIGETLVVSRVDPMSFARLTAATLAPVVLVVLGACSERNLGFAHQSSTAKPTVGDGTGVDCPAFCETTGHATFDLNCGPTDLTSVTLSGPCATGDANPANYVGGRDHEFVSISSPSPGVCHVELKFATGFVYSADVMFDEETVAGPPGCPSCPPFVGAEGAVFPVDNPYSTCVDAGKDAPAGG